MLLLALRQVIEGRQGLLEEGDRLTVRRVSRGLRPSLPKVGHGLGPKLATMGVMSELVDVLGQAVGVEPLNRIGNSRVQPAAPLLQEAAVRDLVREGMLEGILEIGIEPSFVEELARLQVVESATERLVRELGDRLEQGEWHVFADDRGGLQEAFLLRGETVDASCQHYLDRGRNLDRLDRLRQPIPAALSPQHLGLHQHPDGLFQEERIPALDEELLEQRQPGIVPEERVQEFSGTLRRERIQPHLAVAGLAAPSVLVLGTVVHQQQQARRSHAVDDGVEEGLRLAVNPVEIFEDHEKGLLTRLPQQQPPHGVKGLPAPLSRLERLPRGVVHGHVEQGQQRWQRRLERAVEREQLAGHLLPDLAQVVPVLDLEIALEQVDHRPVARRLAVRHGGALEDQPALQAMRVDELVDEAGLAHARLADHRRHLPMTVAGELLGAAELLQLGGAAGEARKPAPGGRLQPGPREPRPCHLVNVHRVGEPPDRHGAKRLHLDVALDQRQRSGRDHDGAGISDLLHPGSEVRRLADRRVVHVQIAADGAHDDFPRVQPDADLHDGRV
jgi:hypothetical protein